MKRNKNYLDIFIKTIKMTKTQQHFKIVISMKMENIKMKTNLK